MKKLKRLFAVLIAVVMLLSVVPVMNVGVTASAANVSLSDLKNKFPQDYHWNHYCSKESDTSNYCRDKGLDCYSDSVTPPGDSYSCYSHSAGGYASYVGHYDCNRFSGATQCCGFAKKISYVAYGSACTNWSKKALSTGLKRGDVIWYSTGDQYGHWVTVIEVNGSAIKVGECNYGGRCRIRWDRTISNVNSLSINAIYNAPWELPLSSTHTHSYVQYYEGAHPHRYYKKCSCGDWYYTGENAATYTQGYEADHPHRCYDTCKICNQNFLNGKTTTMSSCSQCQAATWTWTVKFNANGGSGSVADARVKANTKVTFPNDKFTRVGYRLSGWNAYVQSSKKWVCNNYVGWKTENEIQQNGYTKKVYDWEYFTLDYSWLQAGQNNDTLIFYAAWTVCSHKYDSGVTTKAATCSATGMKTYTCTVCKATKTETIPVNSSNHVNTKNVTATASTCTVKGHSAGVYCNDCKKYISGHTEQPLAAHTLTIINHRDATYDAEGYTGDEYCTTCKQTISAGTAIPRLEKPTDPTPSDPQPSGGCKWCGGSHGGAFGWLVKLFHNLFALIFGARF